MAIRRIVHVGDPVLREKARRVREFNEELGTLIDDMTETMLAAPGVGLAAPQVGVNQRVIVVRLQDDEESREEFGELAGKLFEVVNPEIIKASRELVDGVEACLSVPGYFGSVCRAKSVVIKGQDRHGQEIRIKAYDWLARVFQHEIDHLDGILYTDLADERWTQEEYEKAIS